MTVCPCGSGVALEDCCAPVIAGIPAASPEALMRARYTAFLQGEMAFLGRTLAPEKADAFDAVEVAHSARDAVGLGLEIRAVAGDGQTGTVEYVARFRMAGQPYVHHEVASFRCDEGWWLYVDGDVNPRSAPRQVAKVGRNDPCPCGSGHKFKKCCG